MALVTAVLLVAVREARFGSVSLDDAVACVILAGGALWAIGRVAWTRRGKSSRPDRPKPRRRALPPSPDAPEVP